METILPGSPLAGTGIQPGDRIVEIRPADGKPRPLYGEDLVAAANLIRGEPGTALQLRLFRNKQGTGQLEEHVITVKRDQLYFNQPVESTVVPKAVAGGEADDLHGGEPLCPVGGRVKKDCPEWHVIKHSFYSGCDG